MTLEERDDDLPRDARVRGFVETGGKVVGGVAGAAVGLIGGPVAVLAGGAAGAALGEALAAAGAEFYDRVMAPRQGARAAGALAFATVEIEHRLEAGDEPRADFVDDTLESGDAAEVLEGTLLTAANAFEQKKVPFIGRFYSNVAFDASVSAAHASLLLKLADRLTYGQFRLMATLTDDACLDELMQISVQRSEGTATSLPEVVAEMDDLGTMGVVGVVQSNERVVPLLATMGGGSWSDATLDRARLTPLGVRLHDLLGLVEMDQTERVQVLRALSGQPAGSEAD